MIKVLIADDHVIMRNGIKQLCADMGDVVVAGEAKNGGEVMALLQQYQFDLLLLDLAMPDVNGVELIERVRTHDADLPILVFSMRNEPHVAKRALQAGADGYICKGGEENELVSAIRTVASGGRFVDPVIVEQTMFEKTARKPGESRHGSLSAREMEIMKMIAQGLSLTEIADKLFISVKTVSTHKKNVMAKMNFYSNSELVHYAVANDLNNAEEG